MVDMAVLLSNFAEEEAFFLKTEILTYSVAKWLGNHKVGMGITDPSSLAGVLPCNIGILDNEIYRIMAIGSGESEQQVKNELNAIAEGCIKDCTNPGAPLFEMLANSLQHQGVQYDLKVTHPLQLPKGSQPRIFLSYGEGMADEGIRYFGFEYNLQTGSIYGLVKTAHAAASEGMILFEAVSTDTSLPQSIFRYNDPCHYAYDGSSGGSGGYSGSGGSGGNGGAPTDDDGNAKNAFQGPMVTPPSNQAVCGPLDGLRITELHLADRNEGGLFAGKSEVYVNVTFYSVDASGNINNPIQAPFNACPTCQLYQTNSLSPKTITIDQVTFKLGKQIADVPQANTSTTNQIIITPNSTCCAIPSGDWVLIENGFCEDYENAYNRCMVSVYEHDFGSYVYPLTTVDFPPLQSFDILHYCRQRYFGDIWLQGLLTPSALQFNGNAIYLVGDDQYQVYWTSNTQPGPDKSWCKIELF